MARSVAKRIQRRWWIALVVIAAVVLPVAAWAVRLVATGPWYRSEAAVRVSSQVGGCLCNDDARDEIDERELQGRRAYAAAHLLHPETIRDAIQWPTVRNSSWWASMGNDVDRAVAMIRRHTRVRVVEGEDDIRLTVTMPGKDNAQDLANALIEVHLQSRFVNRFRYCNECAAVAYERRLAPSRVARHEPPSVASRVWLVWPW